MTLMLDALRPKESASDLQKDIFDAFLAVDWLQAIGHDLPEWPIYLRLAVRSQFASHFPIALLVGPDLRLIYNTPYSKILGRDNVLDHMGQKWPMTFSDDTSTNDAVLQEIKTVIRTGETISGSCVRHFIYRSPSFTEETFFDYNTVPLWSETGEVEGVTITVIEQTNIVLAQRRDHAIAQLGAANTNIQDEKELFKAIEKVGDDHSDDIPCLMGYHCNEGMTHDGPRTYSPVVMSGVNPDQLPKVVSQAEADTSSMPLPDKAEFIDYLNEVLRTGKMVRLSDPRIISKFCIRRAFGDLTKDVMLVPIFALGLGKPAGISVQGLNPRRPADDLLFVQQLSHGLLDTLEVMHQRFEREAQAEAKRTELAMALQDTTLNLKDSQMMFEIMAKTCSAGIFIYDIKKEKFEFVNDAYYEITGVEEGGVEDWMSAIHPDSLDAAIDLWRGVTADKPIQNFEARWKAPWRDDKERWSTSSSVVALDRYGNPHIFGSFQDISAMKYSLQMEKERADEAVKTKQQQLEFIDMIAHELRNPLGAIMQSSDFLIEKLTKPARVRSNSDRIITDEDIEDLGTIVLCAQHMSRIINDTLNLSKLEGGLLVATLVPTQPLAVANGVIAMFDAEAKRHKVEMRLELSESWDNFKVDWILTDPSRLTQIFINLIANSLKFVSKMDKREVVITLGASSEPLEQKIMFNRRPSIVTMERNSYKMSSPSFEAEPFFLICHVKDTGPGMSEDQVASLFQRYFQASPKTHVDYGGSGLGLFISKQLVSLLDGDISVESVKDEGATFSFSIKTAPARSPGRQVSISHSDVSDTAETDSNPQTILIAEDNLINQKIMVKQLRQAGYLTMVANNGREAVDILLADRNGDIGLCLCDAEMPVMGGIEAIKEVRQLELEGKLQDYCPFIAVTANARQEQVEEMLEAGMDDCVAKPFRLPDLIAKMEEVMLKLGRPVLKPTKMKELKPVRAPMSRTSSYADGLKKPKQLANLWQNKSFDVVLLNTRLPRITRTIWEACKSLRICADGAADRLHSEVYKCKIEEIDPSYFPTTVIGDLDSITPATRTFYEKTVNVVWESDQNSTDFTKAVNHIDSTHKGSDILVMGGLGGRLDQTMSTLNTLFHRPNIYVFDETNIVMLLFPGTHDFDTTGLGPYCGLVPLKGPVQCHASGLEWPLTGEVLEFNSLISTNNKVNSPDSTITVTCNNYLLFSIEHNLSIT